MILSIIIPIYNAELYLRRTLDSVLNQGLYNSEWELILVDDGSTDDSLSICKEYQKKFPNLINIISKNNEGVSSARNDGLGRAKGKYIYFMDADDYLMPGGFRYLIDNFLDEEYDILTFSSTTIKDFEGEHLPKGSIMGEIIYDGYGCEFLKHNWQTFIWNQFYKLDYIQSNNFSFQKMTISEDVMFNLEVWSKNPKVRIVSSKIYMYIIYNNDNQATKKRDNKHLRACINSQMQLFSYISGLNVSFKEKYGTDNMERLFQSLMRSFMSRVLSSDLSRKEFKKITNNLTDLRLLPMKNIKSKNTKIINFMIHHDIFLPIYQLLYQRLFIPFILPRLSRE